MKFFEKDSELIPVNKLEYIKITADHPHWKSWGKDAKKGCVKTCVVLGLNSCSFRKKSIFPEAFDDIETPQYRIDGFFQEWNFFDFRSTKDAHEFYEKIKEFLISDNKILKFSSVYKRRHNVHILEVIGSKTHE